MLRISAPQTAQTTSPTFWSQLFQGTQQPTKHTITAQDLNMLPEIPNPARPIASTHPWTLWVSDQKQRQNISVETAEVELATNKSSQAQVDLSTSLNKTKDLAGDTAGIVLENVAHAAGLALITGLFPPAAPLALALKAMQVIGTINDVHKAGKNIHGMGKHLLTAGASIAKMAGTGIMDGVAKTGSKLSLASRSALLGKSILGNKNPIQKLLKQILETKDLNIYNFIALAKEINNEDGGLDKLIEAFEALNHFQNTQSQPLLFQGALLFMFNDNGITTQTEATDWLENLGGGFNSSEIKRSVIGLLNTVDKLSSDPNQFEESSPELHSVSNSDNFKQLAAFLKPLGEEEQLLLVYFWYLQIAEFQIDQRRDTIRASIEGAVGTFAEISSAEALLTNPDEKYRLLSGPLLDLLFLQEVNNDAKSFSTALRTFLIDLEIMPDGIEKNEIAIKLYQKGIKHRNLEIAALVKDAYDDILSCFQSEGSKTIFSHEVEKII
ncbi:hypothetical protein BVY03_01495 [bacterium K02(2017)]|nr:hypothetical protein BVY03_01495 [bacterium K02(2017)]